MRKRKWLFFGQIPVFMRVVGRKGGFPDFLGSSGVFHARCTPATPLEVDHDSGLFGFRTIKGVHTEKSL